MAAAKAVSRGTNTHDAQIVESEPGMPTLTNVIAILFIALGPIGYLLSDPEHRSPTAWIPTFVGLPLLVLGLVALRGGNVRKHAMHGVMLLALLAIGGSAVRAVPGWMKLVQGQEVALPLALTMQTILIVGCLLLLVFGVKSFIDARKAMAQATPATE
jgi:hypothetical protein